MRSSHSLLGTLIFLQACATGHKVEDAGPPAESAGVPSAISASPAPATAANAQPTIERSYRSSVAICLDAALRICRERDYQVRSQNRSGDDAASIRAQGRSFDFTLAFARTPAKRTRAVLQLQGRALQESRDEAARLFDRLNEALLEPRD